jgi:hypothetical protein
LDFYDLSSACLLFALQFADRHGNDASVQRQAARCLLVYVETRQVASLLGSLGAGEALVAAMTHPSHSQNAVLQEQILLAVSILCEDASVAQRIIDRGGIDATINIMTSHPTDEGIQECGCTALWHLALDDAAIDRIVTANGHRAVLAGMLAHQAHVAVQSRGCSTMCKLSRDGCLEGSIPAILSALAAQLSQEAFIELAARVLFEFAATRTCCLEIDANQGVDILCAAMQSHPASTSTCTALCTLLFRILSQTGGVPKFVAAGGLSSVLGAMRFHATDRPLHEQASALLSLMKIEANVVVASSVLDLVLALLDHADLSIPVCKYIVTILCRVTSFPRNPSLVAFHAPILNHPATQSHLIPFLAAADEDLSAAARRLFDNIAKNPSDDVAALLAALNIPAATDQEGMPRISSNKSLGASGSSKSILSPPTPQATSV